MQGGGEEGHLTYWPVGTIERYWTRPAYNGSHWVTPHYDGQRYFDGYWDGDHGQTPHNHKWDKGRDHKRDFDRDHR
jgi:hypothetical protein